METDRYKEECVFCKIIAGVLPSTKVFENKDICAFLDINLQAPVHVLIVPKKHIEQISELEQENASLLGNMTLEAARISIQKGLTQGYRLTINQGNHGGQEVDHLHMHLLGGTKLGRMC